MNYVILDLEWNSTYSKKRKIHLNEIFEIGAVKFDSELTVIDTFSMLIRPQVGKLLNPYVKKLTSITFDELSCADFRFQTAIKEFAKFVDGCVLMTWSTSDILALMSNQDYFSGSNRLPFMTKYCDLQSYCEHRLGVGSVSRKLGLSVCAELMNIEIEGDQHRALNDAMLSFNCFKKVYKKSVVDEFIEDASGDDFYKRLTFKAKNITDINSPLIDRSQMFFDCPDCNVRCVQKSKWSVRINGFKAYFVCPECKRKFAGQVSVRQKYKGVSFTKRIVEPKADDDK